MKQYFNIKRDSKGRFFKGTSTKGYKHTENTKQKMLKYKNIETKKCLCCGKDMPYIPGYGKYYYKKKFCSSSCSSKFVPSGIKKTRKEVWTDFNKKISTIKYKRDWHDEKRFGHTGLKDDSHCILCGNEEGLLLHHRDGNNGKQGKLLNNDINNLVVLCRRCHPSIHNQWWLKGVRV